MSPTLGRAVEPDPLGFGAGDADVYRWEGDRPTGVTDPSGLDWDDYLPQAYWDDPLLKALRRYWRSFGTAVSGSSGGLTFQALPDGAGGTGIGGWGGAGGGAGGAGGGGAGWPGGWGPNVGAINAAGQWLWAQVTSLFGHPTPPNFFGKNLGKFSNLFAGWADHLTGGATQQIRAGLGYDDAVDKNSPEYQAGGVIGDVHGAALAVFGGAGPLRGGGAAPKAGGGRIVGGLPGGAGAGGGGGAAAGPGGAGAVRGGAAGNVALPPVVPAFQGPFFGQRRVSPQFGTKGRPPFLAGRTIGEVAADLRAGRIHPDQLPIEAFRLRDGRLVAANTRSLAALSEAGMKPTIVKIIKPSRELRGRLGEQPVIPGAPRPGPWDQVPVTPSMSDLRMLGIIRLVM